MRVLLRSWRQPSETTREIKLLLEKRWLEKSCGNWALVDNLAPSVVAPLVERHSEIIPEIMAWTGSRNMWVRRESKRKRLPQATR